MEPNPLKYMHVPNWPPTPSNRPKMDPNGLRNHTDFVEPWKDPHFSSHTQVKT